MDIKEERLQEAREAYSAYKKVGGKVRFIDFALIFLMREVEFADYQKLIDRLHNFALKAMARSGEAVQICMDVAAHWQTSPEDAKQLEAMRVELKKIMTEYKVAIAPPAQEPQEPHVRH